MIDLRDWNKFQRLESGALKLAGGRHRMVRLEVNTETDAAFTLNGVLLAVASGRDAIVFPVPAEGGTIRCTSEGDVFVFTKELEEGAAEMVAAESFTKPAVRRERNPEVERIMRKMQENADRRARRAVADMEQRLREEFAAKQAVEVVSDDKKPAGKPAKGKAAKQPDTEGGAPESGAPAEPAGAADA